MKRQSGPMLLRKGLVALLVAGLLAGSTRNVRAQTSCDTEAIRGYVESVRWPDGAGLKPLDWKTCFAANDSTAAYKTLILESLSDLAQPGQASREGVREFEAKLFTGVSVDDLRVLLQSWAGNLNLTTSKKRLKDPVYEAVLAASALMVLNRSNGLVKLGVKPVTRLQNLLQQSPDWPELEKELQRFPKIPLWPTQDSKALSLAELNRRALQLERPELEKSAEGNQELEQIAEQPMVEAYWGEIGARMEKLARMQWMVSAPAGCESALCNAVRSCNEKRDPAAWKLLKEQVQAGKDSLDGQVSQLKKSLPIPIDWAVLDGAMRRAASLADALRSAEPYGVPGDQITKAVEGIEFSLGKIGKLRAVATYRKAVKNLIQGEVSQARQALDECSGCEGPQIAAARMMTSFFQHGPQGEQDYCNAHPQVCGGDDFKQAVENLRAMLRLEGGGLTPEKAGHNRP